MKKTEIVKGITEKKQKSKELYGTRGITLVALVITIIIIIILATVTINMAFGDDGIIKRAQQAADMYANDTAYTDQAMANATAYLDEMLNGVTGGGADEPETPEVPSDWDLTKVTPVLSEDNQYVPVPKGFTASIIDGEKSVNDGFVIKQGDNGAATTGVNEFVWIPVDEESLEEMYNTSAPGTVLSKSTLNEETTTTDVYSNLRIRNTDSSVFIAGKPGTVNSREPDIIPDTEFGDAAIGYDYAGIEPIKNVLGITGTYVLDVLKNYSQSLVNEYQTTYRSIEKYNGFYIGRYELTGTIEKPTVQKGEKVIGSDYTIKWYHLKKMCIDLVNTEYVQTEMIYGNQWDEVMDWLIETGEKTENQINEDSSSWGNYSNYNQVNGYESGDSGYVEKAGIEILTSGFSENWKANNIYDLAGNAAEWTQEAFDTNIRNARGGFYFPSGIDMPVSCRWGKSVVDNEGTTSRVTMIIK